MRGYSNHRSNHNEYLKEHLDFVTKKSLWRRFKKNIIIFTILNIIWFIFRTGRKPTRITYPCQQIALNNISLSASSLIVAISLSAIFTKVKNCSFLWKILFVAFLILTPVTVPIILQTKASGYEIVLPIKSKISSEEQNSDIFVVSGRDIAHIHNLIDLMGENNLNFYKSSTLSNNTGPDGLISASDVILIKNNCQWDKRGGTNTDLIKELVQAIINHPEGFTGEIVIADNGQGRGAMTWTKNNAENISQSTRDVANLFSNEYRVSAYLWDNIRTIQVDEYSNGDMNDGYVINSTADAETEITVSYPKFETIYGTKISFKHGIWNGTHYEKRLKIINTPILKSHSSYGVTAAMKHYMGVQSQPLGQGHDKIDTGGMATLMVELGLPTLNILDAIWINANPETSFLEGPATDYDEATRTNMILASTDPIALDYWAAKNILYNVSKLIGYQNPYSLDPDSTDKSGLEEAFGVWLNNSKQELLRANYNVTSDENHMNIYANSSNQEIEILGKDYRLWTIIGSIGSGLILAASFTLIILSKKGIVKLKRK